MWDGDIWKEWGAAEERSWLMCVNLFGCGAAYSCYGNVSPDSQFGLDDVEEVGSLDEYGTVGTSAEGVLLGVLEDIAQGIVIPPLEQEMMAAACAEVQSCTSCESVFEFLLHLQVILFHYLVGPL